MSSSTPNDRTHLMLVLLAVAVAGLIAVAHPAAIPALGVMLAVAGLALAYLKM